MSQSTVQNLWLFCFVEQESIIEPCQFQPVIACICLKAHSKGSISRIFWPPKKLSLRPALFRLYLHIGPRP